MKYLIIKLISIVFTTACIAQQSKPIVPNVGNIVFNKEEIMVNEDVFQKSIDNFLQLVQHSAIDERRASGLETDSLWLAITKEDAKKSIISKDGHPVRQHHIFRDSLIVEFTTLDDKIIGDYTVINKLSGQTEMLAKKDSTTFYLKRPYAYSDIKIKYIKEFRNETRLIGGFKCFKIIYLCTEQTDFSEELNFYRELWVTDRILCQYHPIVKEKQILKKYYPLEVLEYSEMLKGIMIVSKLYSIHLK
ncbi:hypothetical protein [Flavobacterium sp. MK4S-17]|uniref:hypothetical protein n=1 Tax=Flavobacterium sp. MK4S-17 TaxID=2543737 RepID=UPI00135B2BDB|nr:hypothetical protein [Flavobacterium sp. MK4S-17]